MIDFAWELVMRINDVPVKTGVKFPTYDACMMAELEARTVQSQFYNKRAPKGDAMAPTRTFMQNQISSGVCIPASK